MRVAEHTTTMDDVPVFYRSAGTQQTSPVYLHDAPGSSDDWLPFLERTGGVAPDLIGFGRSGKGGHLDYSPQGLADFVERLLAKLSADSIQLVGHGWGGAIALLVALRDPARVRRLVLVDAVPLLGGFRWHLAARLWRRRVIGELVMGATSRRQLARQLRRGMVQRGALSQARLDAVWDQFDQGTQRALLRVHRAADEHRLPEFGAGIGTLGMPALIVWGEEDPWLGPQFADAYAAELPGAAVERIADAGHWPWLDQPGVVELVASFLERP